MYDLIGLGVSTVDLVALVDHLPVQEEVQRAIEMVVQGGGPIATAMVTAARLGARVAMLDSIGDDWRGKLILDEFARENVFTGDMRVHPNHTSSTACIMVHQATGARSIVYAPGTAPELTPDDLPRAEIESARFLHVNGRHWDACLQAIEWARAANVQVSFDGGAHRYRPQIRQLVALANVCIVAHEFAMQYTGETDVRKSAEVLLAVGPSLVVITEGIQGSWISTRDGKFFHQPAFRFPKAIDTTGCGDSYHGAFLFGLLQEWSLEKTARWASAVAALNSQALGGRSGLPTYEQVENFLEQRDSECFPYPRLSLSSWG